MVEFEVYTRDAVYTKTETDNKYTQKATMPSGKNLTDTVTFQDLVDMGFIVVNQ